MLIEDNEEFTTLRFMHIGKFKRRSSHAYDDTILDSRKVYLVFHDDETLGVRIYGLEGCLNYIKDYPKKLNLNTSSLTTYEKSKLIPEINSHNNYSFR